MIQSQRRQGFKLIELVVVIAIFGIAIALLVPSVRKVREPAERTVCVNNLKQIILAMHNFASTQRQEPYPENGRAELLAKMIFPPGCFGLGTLPEERLSWMAMLLPYVEQDPLYRQLDPKKGYEGNLPAVKTLIPMFLCPASQEVAGQHAVTHYVAMSGIGYAAANRPVGASGNGFMGYDRITSIATIKDGTSNTIALMETRVNLGPWARGGTSTLRGFDPADLPLHGDNRPFGGHSNGMHAAMADGSVRFLPSTIDANRLAAAITINGGEVVNLE